MTFDLYASISILTVIFTHFFIGSSKRVLLCLFFLSIFLAVFVYNNRHLMSQMNTKKKNLKILDLNPVQLVHLVTDRVGCCMA